MVPQRGLSPGRLSPRAEAVGRLLPAHPLQVPGSAGTPLCRACLHSRACPLTGEGAAPVPEGSPPRRGLWTFLPPRPPRPASPNPGAPWSHRRPTAATSASCGCQSSPSEEEAGAGVGVPGSSGGPASSRRGVSVPGGRGRVVLWQGGERMPVLRAWLGPGRVRGLIPWGLFSPAPPVPVCSCHCSAPAAASHTPSHLLGFLLGRALVPHRPQDRGPESEPQLGACSDPAC